MFLISWLPALDSIVGNICLILDDWMKGCEEFLFLHFGTKMDTHTYTKETNLF